MLHVEEKDICLAKRVEELDTAVIVMSVGWIVDIVLMANGGIVHQIVMSSVIIATDMENENACIVMDIF